LGQKGSGRGHVTYFWNFGTPSISRERLEPETSNLASRLITIGTKERNTKLGQKGSGRGHVTYFWNFGTPSISRERLEIETPNFACRFITRGTDERNAKLGQNKGSRDLLLKFWDPIDISGTVSATNVKFGKQIDHHMGTNERNAKLGQKRSGRGHVTYFWNFWDPLHISGMVGARNVKFGLQIHSQLRKKCKIRSKGARKESGHVYFWNFRTLHISGTVWSYIRQIWRADSSREALTKKNKIMLKGSRRGHVTYFWYFGTPPYLGNEVVITQPWIELSIEIWFWEKLEHC